MIRLGLSRLHMLADIGADEGELGAPLLDPEDPAFVERESVRLVVRAHLRDELCARLEPALRLRFANVAGEHLERDLLVPLWKAIGNAHRRGNLEDPARWLSAEIVGTDRGAVVTVTDEGAGFDVAGVVRRFESEERYFTRKGQGIACFAETCSLVSYADGGRTWLLRFLSDPEPGEPLAEDANTAFGPAGDAGHMRAFLSDQPRFRDHGITLDSCRVYAVSRAPDPTELAYVLRCRAPGQEPEATVLTGRLLPEAAARADVSMTEQLRAAGVGAKRGLAIPRPLGAFGGLALFELDPSENFRERIRKLSALGPLAFLLRIIAVGLAAIHMSAVSLAAEESFEEVLGRHKRSKQRIEARFSNASERERASACFDRLLEKAGDLQPCPPVPIHGALEWECIVESGERWSLYRFDRSRLSHPLLDVGVFLADLLRFHTVRAKGDRALGEGGRAAFLNGYFEGARPPWSKDLDWFVAGALLERLERMTRRKEEKWAPKVTPLLDEIERTL
jgi:hypothetical protein